MAKAASAKNAARQLKAKPYLLEQSSNSLAARLITPDIMMQTVLNNAQCCAGSLLIFRFCGQ
ncbi:MAG: hypothetical protein BVN35_03665 [Proteobacteria bacterium ST_bin11]|nr:MAG: hypothetical protein BVN35_03665 [Proteobacteria bacterium ST_bin11]